MNADDDEPERARRRPYARPVLLEYGSVRELTRGGSGPSAEFFGLRRFDPDGGA
jgi:hypothetical protein